MKRILYTIIAAVVAFTACNKFDDTRIWDKLNDHEERIMALETLCGQMNTNIASLQTIVKALQENDYVTNVVAIMESGVEVGYQLTFSKGKTVTIYHGKDGQDGAPGKDGEDGTDGKDGQNGAPGADGKDGLNGTNGKDGVDGKTPVIGVRQDADGVYYWTLNGEWLLDDNGNKIPTTGEDGKDGQDGADGKDGQDGTNGSDGKDGVDGTPGADGKDGVDGTDGKDGITPQLKIEDDYWCISYDNGATWSRLGKATGEDGQDGAPGADGKDGLNGTDGKDGIDGDSMFASVDVTNTDYIIFTLANGTQFKIPTWKAFEELKTMVEQMNQNIEALQTIVTALQNNDYVTSISPIYEGVREIGYVINFSKSGKVTIYHGEDGADGNDGQDGAPGQDGTNGKDGVDGKTPVIGIKQDTDGKYYWTLNGEWLLDDNGNKIPTTGQDGADGKDGQDGADGKDGQNGVDGAPGVNGADGKDAITPQLKIENNYWYISYDDGNTWTQLGKATGEDGKDGQDGAQGPQGSAGKDGNSFFKDVDATNKDYITITLIDGTAIKLPTWSAFEALQQRVDQMNDNISALQEIITVLQQNDYVTSVSPLVENRKVIGYMISFSKSGSVTIYHGQNGADGDDGHTPVISVKQDTDGVFYWTIDGEWVKDSDGNKIPTTGKDGQAGESGVEGKDGITPQFKIEDSCWHISYDNGNTWTQLGKATGETGKDGDSFFQSVTQDEYYVYLTLSDGTIIQIPNGPSYTDVPQINNSYIRPKTKDEPIKILCFGSSWFHNTWWYLNKITKNLGINAEIHGYDLGSSYFDEWIDLYNNDLSPFTGSLSWRGAYRYVSTNGEDYICSERVAGSEFGDQEYRDAWYNDLVSEEWDIIAFQQGAIQAPKREYWESGSELVSIIKRHCGPNTIIAFNHTWTPSITSQYIPNATNGLCSNTLEGQKLWQTMNDDNCKRFMNITGLNDISPNGAMMYTLRRDQKINSDGDDLCYDGLHPNHGLPMFAIACVFYETFIAPFYGISIKECTWLPSTSDKRVPFNSSVFRPVTETKRDRIYEYVRLSISNRFGFNEPYPYDESFNNSNEDLGSSEGEW